MYPITYATKQKRQLDWVIDSDVNHKGSYVVVLLQDPN